jgi:hypothetical protein
MHPFSHVDGHRKPAHAGALIPRGLIGRDVQNPGMPRVGGVT